MITVGLTGGIGSGKSSAAKVFKSFGVPVIDADQLTRQLMLPSGEAYPALQVWLGNDYFDEDGLLDRRALRQLVFNNPEKLKILEGIVHPLVGKAFKKRINSLTKENHSYAVVEIPLLTRHHKETLVDRVVVVDCEPETQIVRSSRRDKASAEDIRKIIAQQLSRTDRLALADDVINNDGDLKQLSTQIETLHKQYMNLDSASE